MLIRSIHCGLRGLNRIKSRPISPRKKGCGFIIRKKMDKTTTIGLMLLLGLTFNVLVLAINGERVSYQGLCTDGDGDINLEGFQCQKSYWSVFGLSENDTHTLELSVFGIFFLGLIILWATMGSEMLRW